MLEMKQQRVGSQPPQLTWGHMLVLCREQMPAWPPQG